MSVVYFRNVYSIVQACHLWQMATKHAISKTDIIYTINFSNLLLMYANQGSIFQTKRFWFGSKESKQIQNNAINNKDKTSSQLIRYCVSQKKTPAYLYIHRKIIQNYLNCLGPPRRQYYCENSVVVMKRIAYS